MQLEERVLEASQPAPAKSLKKDIEKIKKRIETFLDVALDRDPRRYQSDYNYARYIPTGNRKAKQKREQARALRAKIVTSRGQLEASLD